MLNVVLFFITILVVFLAGSESHAQTKVKIAHAVMSPRVAPVWVAHDQRLFTKYGIDPDIIFVRGDPTVVAAMASGDIQIVYARIANRGEDASEVGIGGEERGLDQRRARDGVADLFAFGLVLTALDLHGDELGRAFAVAHDGLRQPGRDFGDGGL